VEELEARGPGALDDEVAVVDGAVVGLAEQAHVLGVVLAAVGPAVGVVLMEETGLATAADGAAAAVAAHDLAAHGRGDGLGSAGACRGRRCGGRPVRPPRGCEHAHGVRCRRAQTSSNGSLRVRQERSCFVSDGSRPEAEVVPLLEADDDGGLEAKSVLEHLMREHPGKFEPGQLRTLQRRFRDWRAVHGVEREVFFPQQHEAGRTPSRLRAQDPYPGTIPRPFLHAVRTADRPAKVVVADRQK
jgi:hypothetical protein